MGDRFSSSAGAGRICVLPCEGVKLRLAVAGHSLANIPCAVHIYVHIQHVLDAARELCIFRPSQKSFECKMGKKGPTVGQQWGFGAILLFFGLLFLFSGGGRNHSFPTFIARNGVRSRQSGWQRELTFNLIFRPELLSQSWPVCPHPTAVSSSAQMEGKKIGAIPSTFAGISTTKDNKRHTLARNCYDNSSARSILRRFCMDLRAQNHQERTTFSRHHMPETAQYLLQSEIFQHHS